MGFSSRPTQTTLTGDRQAGDQNIHYPQLDFNEISLFIEDNSVDIKYWKAYKCPCSTIASEQPKINCASCRGLGWTYLGVEGEFPFLKAQIHQRSSHKEYKRYGSNIVGTATITFRPGVIPGEGDLVQSCLDREVVNDEVHVVGSTLTDGSTAETLRFRDVKCVENVIMYDYSTKVPFEVPRDRWFFDPAQRRVLFVPEYDAGTKYSVRYIAAPEYILRQETAKPLLRITGDEGLGQPLATRKDIIYPFMCQGVRLDRAMVQRLRGQVDTTAKSTFNNKSGRGPFV